MADPRRAREEPSSEIALEDFEDALVDGDRSVRVGTARAALAYPTFRRVYFGSLASSIGSWMQNVILGAYVYQETLSSTWVALVTLAQLGPLLLLSLVGGMIADRFERRTVLILVSVEQTAFSLLIAKLTAAEHPSMWLLLAAVLAIGIGQAIYAPSYSALIPTLVEPRDLTGAISLNSASMNLSRVIVLPSGGSCSPASGLRGCSSAMPSPTASSSSPSGVCACPVVCSNTPRTGCGGCSGVSGSPATTGSWAAA